MGRYCSEHGHTLTDRTIIMAQNGRHGLRGISARNPSEFEAYQDDDDNLTYTVDMASYLGSATISSVTRVPYGLTVGNPSNTTTQLSQRLKGFGYVDIKVSLSSGDTEQFRIHIVPRVPTQITGAQDYIEVPVATTSTSDPTTSDDSTRNFVPGTVWINTATQNVWTCISNAVGVARWRHTPRVWQGGAAVNLTGTVSDTEMVGVSIPANALGANGALDYEASFQATNNGNNKTGSVRYSGVSGTVFQSITQTTNFGWRQSGTIINRNATASQVGIVAGAGTGGWSPAASGQATATVDTTAATTLSFVGTLGNSADTITLQWYRVTLTRPDIA